MILVLAPYPTLERVALISTTPPTPKRPQKPMQIRVFAGGSGLRAAQVLQLLGGEPLALTVAGGRTGTLLGDRLDAQGVAHRLVKTAASTRGSLLTVDREHGVQSNVPEQAALLTEEEADKFYTQAETLIPSAELLLVGDANDAGSVQDRERLTRVLRVAQNAGVPVLCDGGGVSLDAASDAGAWLVRVGLRRLQARTEQSLQHDSAIIAAAQDIRAAGVENVLVTLGPEGALLIGADGVWRIKAPIVSHYNATGSGETFSGALAAQYVRTRDLVDAARYGCAAASVNVTHDEPGYASPGEVGVLYPRTTATPIAGRS